MDFSIRDLLPNVTFKTSRSGGKGGQNVNKVSSKVEVNFNFRDSGLFDDIQKELIRNKLGGRMTSDGELRVVSEEERSQYLNKERALQKLYLLVKNALFVRKARKATKPKKSAVEQRLKNKQQQALKKLSRKKGGFDI